MALPLTDGTLVAGSFTANINGTIYILNNARLTLPTKVIERTNETDIPVAAYIYAGTVRTGTAEMQVNNAAQKIDLRSENFVTNEFTNANITFVITEQTPARTKDGLATATINFREKIN
jgi:hypothetical protein